VIWNSSLDLGVKPWQGHGVFYKKGPEHRRTSLTEGEDLGSSEGKSWRRRQPTRLGTERQECPRRKYK